MEIDIGNIQNHFCSNQFLVYPFQLWWGDAKFCISKHFNIWFLIGNKYECRYRDTHPYITFVRTICRTTPARGGAKFCKTIISIEKESCSVYLVFTFSHQIRNFKVFAFKFRFLTTDGWRVIPHLVRTKVALGSLPSKSQFFYFPIQSLACLRKKNREMIRIWSKQKLCRFLSIDFRI